MNQKSHVLDRFVCLTETDPDLPDFPTACRRLHVTPGVLNEMLLREVGVDGERFILDPYSD